MLWLNLQRLMADKEVKGFDYRVVILTTAWGFWNLFYYPMVGHMFSFYAGIGVVAMNSTWLWLVWRYSRQRSGVDKEKWRRIYAKAKINRESYHEATLEEYALTDRPLEK